MKEYISKSFLLEWAKSTDAIKSHFLFNEEKNANALKAAEPFLKWLE